MSFVVEFYKELDTVNLIIFWGVIIVVLLLLIFAIIIANKNRKLERIIEKNGIDIDSYDDDLAIKKETNINVIKESDIENTTIHEEQVSNKPITNNSIKDIENTTIHEEQASNKPITNNSIKVETEKEFTPLVIEEKTKENDEIPITEMPVIEEKKETKFVAEEHVMEYRNEPSKPSNIERQSTNKLPEKEIFDNRTPYGRNVLKEMASSQTSPIGIAIRHTDSEKEISKARELHNALNEQNIRDNLPKSSTNDEYLVNQKKYANTYKEPTRKGNYLEELSKKLSNDTTSDISRTEYELRQEEDAIISYQELMEKKDSIKTIDEEEAVISIDELIAKKKQQEKLYNITKEEENDNFIKELKDFRSDL